MIDLQKIALLLSGQYPHHYVLPDRLRFLRVLRGYVPNIDQAVPIVQEKRDVEFYNALLSVLFVTVTEEEFAAAMRVLAVPSSVYAGSDVSVVASVHTTPCPKCGLPLYVRKDGRDGCETCGAFSIGRFALWLDGSLPPHYRPNYDRLDLIRIARDLVPNVEDLFKVIDSEDFYSMALNLISRGWGQRSGSWVQAVVSRLTVQPPMAEFYNR